MASWTRAWRKAYCSVVVDPALRSRSGGRRWPRAARLRARARPDRRRRQGRRGRPAGPPRPRRPGRTGHPPRDRPPGRGRRRGASSAGLASSAPRLGREDLLGEERIAVRSRQDRIDEARRRRRARGSPRAARRSRSDRAGCNAIRSTRGRRSISVSQASSGWPRVEVVGPDRGDDRQSLGTQVAGQEREQVASGRVGPVEILDDQDDGGCVDRAARAGRGSPRRSGPGASPPAGTATARTPTRRTARGRAGRARSPPARSRHAAARPRPGLPVTGGSRRSGRTAGRCRRAGRSSRPGRASRGRGRRRTARPSARTPATSSAIRRLLPIPASPSTSVSEGWPSAAAATAASSSASSTRRPTKTGLVTRPDISSMVATAGAT